MSFDALSILAGLVLGLLAGAGLAWAVAARRAAHLRAEGESARIAAAGAEARLAAESRAHEERLRGLESVHAEIERKLTAIADAALRQNSASFLDSAKQLFEAQKTALASEAETRRAGLDALLKPVTETLTQYQERLAEVEKARAEAYGGLTGQITQMALAQDAVRSEAQKLTNALRAAPKTRGRWGEHQLRNVMELAGMAEHVDFATETSFQRDDERLRPDAIINLPGGQRIVIDAKASMSAYLDAVETTDEALREQLLRKHAQELRGQADRLGSKEYWAQQGMTTDFVAMFVPGDNFFAAAMERDPDLFANAIARRVIIVTPTTLVALAKTVALGWRQQAVERNALAVSELGQELYRRLQTMGDHVSALGRALQDTVQKYNAFVGSLETNVLPQARRFKELQVETGGKQITEAKPIELAVREPRADRDLQISKPKVGAF
ncbi:DNA recombination protein RmuC [Desertibaculum subflavum]|uniref:DNA recombination protein RmuC n=1 Tax=Desertibaculum subflavum TaxID=2268458 RepID=UPI000E66A161